MTPEQIAAGKEFIAKQDRRFVEYVAALELDTTFTPEAKLASIFQSLNDYRKALIKFEKSLGIKD